MKRSSERRAKRWVIQELNRSLGQNLETARTNPLWMPGRSITPVPPAASETASPTD
jgi:hypothetical protein